MRNGTITMKEAACLAGVTQQSILNWRRENRFRWGFKRDSNRILIDKESFLFYLERRRIVAEWSKKEMVSKELQILRDMLISMGDGLRFGKETDPYINAYRKKGGVC